MMQQGWWKETGETNTNDKPAQTGKKKVLSGRPMDQSLYREIRPGLYRGELADMLLEGRG